MKPTTIETDDGPTFGAFHRMSHIVPWAPTVPQLREIALRFAVTGLSRTGLPPEVRQYAPFPAEVQRIGEAVAHAFRQGRVIDCGHLPNAVLSRTAKRGGPLYVKHLLPLPFHEPWVMYHTWEQGPAVYLVHPLEPQTIGANLEVAELLPMRLETNQVMVIGCRGLLVCELARGFSAATNDDWSHYPVNVVPSPFHCILDTSHPGNNGQDPGRAAWGNIMDPVMTVLMMLSTMGLQRETIAAPDRLQRARAKIGKPPIPPYERLHSAPYVTALMARIERACQEGKYGTHASPIPHLRRGHIRHYTTGKQIFVADSLVNFTVEARAAFAANRSHYELLRSDSTPGRFGSDATTFRHG